MELAVAVLRLEILFLDIVITSHLSAAYYIERYPSTCKEIRTHVAGAGDGEYWLNVTQVTGSSADDTEHVIARIYCHNMAAFPVELLSLTEYNYGYIDDWFPSHVTDWMHGTTVYTKVKLEFPLAAVVEADFSIITSGNLVTPTQYGVALDCLNEHWGGTAETWNTEGRFSVNLQNTGYAVSSQTGWVRTGWQGGLTVTIDASRQVVSGLCGGHSGGCEPSPSLYLSTYTPDYSAPLVATTKLLREGNFWHSQTGGKYTPRVIESADNHDAHRLHVRVYARSLLHCFALCNSQGSCLMIEYDAGTKYCEF